MKTRPSLRLLHMQVRARGEKKMHELLFQIALRRAVEPRSGYKLRETVSQKFRSLMTPLAFL
jgi:hypothetical protein